jgi:excinuclease ABC subunit C
VLATLLTQMYGTDRYVPREILVPLEPHDLSALEQWLRTRRGAVVEIVVPQIGAKKKLLEMAQLNAREQDRVAADQQGRDQESLQRLQELLGLEEVPDHIHCLDISTIQGRSTVASRVAFRGGRPEKAGYRKFRIRSITGQDDFAAMAEALERSLGLCLEKDEDLPDLVVIDGGKGQLASAREVLGNLGLLDEVAIVGLAKDRMRVRGSGSSAVREQTGERVFLPGRELPIPLRPGEPETHLMTHVRDEAHRFAITYHRKLRGRIGSQLDQIPGVGPTRRRSLLRRFGGITGVMKASVAELGAVEGTPSELAQRIWTAFHQNEAVE